MKVELQETAVTPERDSFGGGTSHYRVTVKCVVNDKERRSNSCVLPAHAVFSDQFDHILARHAGGYVSRCAEEKMARSEPAEGIFREGRTISRRMAHGCEIFYRGWTSAFAFALMTRKLCFKPHQLRESRTLPIFRGGHGPTPEIPVCFHHALPECK